MNFCPEKLNVILVTLHKNEPEEYFLSALKFFKERHTNFHKSFKQDSEDTDNFHKSFKQDSEDTDNFYNILRYYVFGYYDIAFITLTESDKFAQKLFAPTDDNGKTPPSNYQILTGITKSLHKDFKLNNFFNDLKNENNKDNNSSEYNYLKSKYKFIIISSLKLNPGHLLGGYMNYFEEVELLLNKTITDNGFNGKHVLIRSFSWNDITLLVFDNDPNKLRDIILNIRKLTYKDLNKTTIDTIYDQTIDFGKLNIPVSMLDGKSIKQKCIEDSHIFIETQTHFGVDYDSFTDGTFTGTKIFTNIEFKIKSGHEQYLIRNIYNDSKLKDIFKKDEHKFIYGSTDIVMPEVNNEFSNNQTVIKELKKPDLKKHLRKIRTNIYSDLPIDDNGTGNPQDIIDFRFLLQKLIFTENKIAQLNKNLKKLKTPRHLRQKAIKMYYSYNNGIQDPVLSLSFLDFNQFLIEFLESIERYNKIYDDKTNFEIFDVNEIEKTIERSIRVFDKSLQSRTLNTYMYEEMGDIDLDYQSSIQKLLSIFNSIVNLKAHIFPYKDTIKHHGFLVNSHLNNTVGNIQAINFNIHHLTAPEFIFISLEKEILNGFFDEEDILHLFKSLQGLNKDTKDIFQLHNLDENNCNSLLEYVLIDLIRVDTTFGGKLDLYYYFSWFFNLQNSTLYATNGFIKPENFLFELKRILLVIFLKDKDFLTSENIYLPTVELADEWNREFKLLYETIKNDKNNGAQIEIRRIDDVKKQFETKFQDIINPNNLQPNKVNYLYFLNEFDISVPLSEMYSNILNNTKSKVGDYYLKYLYILLYNLISFLYLNKIFEHNKANGKPTIELLKRNLNTGIPLDSFLDNDKDNSKNYYLLDNQGGIFFIKEEKLKLYYELRDEYLNILFDLHLRIKTNNFVLKLN